MKHLKTFESFSINEEEGVRKFFTGHDSSDERDQSMMDFHKALDEAEEKVSENPEGYVFDRPSLEKKAKEDNYKGGLRIQRGGRDKSRMYVVYDKGVTGFEDIAGSASKARN